MSKLYVLVVTEDGYGKRIPLSDVPKTKIARKGVKLSSVPIVSAFTVSGTGDVILATRKGKIKVVPIVEVPIRSRRVGSNGRMSKGARLLKVGSEDKVARAVLSRPDV